MDLSVFSEASTAVAKVMKDYQPIVRLGEELAEVRARLEEVGELDAAREQAAKALADVLVEKTTAENALAQIKKDTAQAEGVLARVKAALSGIKL